MFYYSNYVTIIIIIVIDIDTTIVDVYRLVLNTA